MASKEDDDGIDGDENPRSDQYLIPIASVDNMRHELRKTMLWIVVSFHVKHSGGFAAGCGGAEEVEGGKGNRC